MSLPVFLPQKEAFSTSAKAVALLGAGIAFPILSSCSLQNKGDNPTGTEWHKVFLFLQIFYFTLPMDIKLK